MTTDQIETILERRLNAAKHRNPPSVLNALGIANGFIGNKITVTYASGRYWAGAATQEFCCGLGRTLEDAEKTLAAKSL